MNALPIVHRELRIASRKRGTYISRAVVAGIVVLLWLVLSVASGRHMSTTELAKSLFWTYGILALVYALLSGVFFTADSLSAERRDGTLGLLFLTDLKGFDVVLGKLAATSWHGVYSLLVIVPVLGLPLLMGGVSHAEMARLVVVILTSLFYSLALGLLVSTLCRRLVTVVAATFLILLLQCGLPWVLAALLEEMGGLGADRNPIVWLCPFTAMAFVPDMMYRSGWGAGPWFSGLSVYWWPVVVMAGMGTVCLGSACWLLPRRWRREQEPRVAQTAPTAAGVGAPGQALGGAVRQAASRPGASRRGLIETNPYRWLVLREGGLNRWLSVSFVLLCLLCLGFLALSLTDRTEDLGLAVAFFGAFGLHVVLKTWLSLESSRRFCEDRQSGALELLLVTPVRVRDVIRGELNGMSRQFRVPMGLASVVNLALVLVVVLFDPVNMHADRLWFSEIILWGGVVLWLDARAIGHVGMLTGLKASRHHRAVLGTLARVLFPPWAGVVLFFLVIMLPGHLNEDGFKVCMRTWFFLCAGLDLLLIQHAGNTLRLHLRPLAAGERPLYASDDEPMEAGEDSALP